MPEKDLATEKFTKFTIRNQYVTQLMKHLSIIYFTILSTVAILFPDMIQADNWALPHISVAHVRTEPRHGAEMSTQVLMGMPLKVIAPEKDGWVEVEMPDGYRGFVNANSLTIVDDKGIQQWRKSPRLFVKSFEETKIYSDSAFTADVVSDIVSGDILEGTLGKRWSHVKLPDGRTGWVRSTLVASLDSVYRRQPAEGIIAIASHQMGTPYLWGGLSSKGMDCSGLVKMAFYDSGRILKRDASQQALTGSEVKTQDLKRGDLVFFASPSGRINHVGIYDGDGYYIESAGRVRRTKLSDRDDYVFARRIIGNEGTDGIIRLSDHPWYIQQTIEP